MSVFFTFILHLSFDEFSLMVILLVTGLTHAIAIHLLFSVLTIVSFKTSTTFAIAAGAHVASIVLSMYVGTRCDLHQLTFVLGFIFF